MEISIVLQLQSSRFIPQQLRCININHMHNIQVGEGGIEGVEREREPAESVSGREAAQETWKP